MSFLNNRRLCFGSLILALLTPRTLLGAHLPNSERQTQEYFVAYYCHQYLVSEPWVRAIITVESNWLTNAISEKGAVGLMQLMPATARRFGVCNRFDSAANIEGGIKFLAWLLAYLHGNRILATAAYFAGEGRIAGRDIRDFSPQVLAYVRKVYFHLTSELLRESSSWGKR